MSELARQVLTRLGLGESIDHACSRAAITRDEFNTLWRAGSTPKILACHHAGHLQLRSTG